MATIFRVTAHPGNIVAEGTRSPVIVTGLTNGVDYTFTITAENEVGESIPSEPSYSVRVAGPPGAPQAVVGTAGEGSVSIAFSAPLNDGGHPILDYTATANPGGATGTEVTSPIVISGLTNGQSYTFTVAARNRIGIGTASDPSASVIPYTVPDAPTIGTASPGEGDASIAFTPPVFNGGRDIIDYLVTSTPGGFTGTGSSSPIVVSGLSNGTAYTFKVKARNIAGYSQESSASNSATPYTVPDAPTIGAAEAMAEAAKLYFNIPAFDGGSPVTGYTVYAYRASDSVQVGSQTGSASPIIVSGLTVGVAVKMNVKATNARGDSALSSYSTEVTPTASASVPEAPTVTNAYASNGSQLTIVFSTNGDGGSPITSIETQCNLSVSPYTTYLHTGLAPSTTSDTFTGLITDSSYYIRARAVNAIGAGNWGEWGSAVTIFATVPGAPTGISAASGQNGQTSVTFSAPSSNGGAPIQGYQVGMADGKLASSNGSPIIVSGMNVGSFTVSYVRAYNRVGQSNSMPGTGGAVGSNVAPNLPGLPTSASATAGTESATVTWTNPTVTGGGAGITGYRVYIYPGTNYQSFSSSPAVVTGLTGGENYRFAVAAVNGTTGVGGKSNITANVVPSFGGGPP